MMPGVRPDHDIRLRSVISAVVFDVGEVLVDETREYGTWADWLRVPRHSFSAVFGSVIARGLDYRETFQVFAAGFDLTAQRAARIAAGEPETFDEQDLYPDVRPSLRALREAGLWLGSPATRPSEPDPSCAPSTSGRT